MNLVVAPCTVEAAKYAVENWHYSRRMPVFPLVCCGAWEDGRFVGAVLFGNGACPHLVRPFGLPASAGAELVRVALRDHRAPVSQIVSRAVRTLRVGSPGLRLLVSFADPAHGHHGGIYQAMNWIYTGTTKPSWAFIDLDQGIVRHKRILDSKYKGPRIDADQRVPLPGKHRYVLPLDQAMRRQLASIAQPYPRKIERG